MRFFTFVKYTIIRVLPVLVAHFDYELGQIDVTMAFLHGKLDESTTRF